MLAGFIMVLLLHLFSLPIIFWVLGIKPRALSMLSKCFLLNYTLAILLFF